jgi:mannose-6-phosphate isomerase-like protein (cupin superfamily)
MRADLALVRPLDAYAFEPVRVEKPWGYELIWSLTERYCGKMLIVHAGEALSLQLHRRKDETIHVHAGLVEVEMGEAADSLTTEVVMAGRGFRVRPGVVHRIRALEDSLILEVSTPDLDDVVRLEDAYGREK